MLYTEDFSMHHYVGFSQIGSHICVYIYIHIRKSHAVENNLHKQQCIIGTCKYNALHKIYTYCMFTSSHECGLCNMHTSYKLFSPGHCLTVVVKDPHILPPPTEFSGYRPGLQHW